MAATIALNLPMPSPVNPPRPLTSYKYLSFDVYGSLIEYKPHIFHSFQPLLSRLAADSVFLQNDGEDTEHAGSGAINFLKLFQSVEDNIKTERPLPRFDEILKEMWRRIANELGVETSEREAENFGQSIPTWPAFHGTVQALQVLQKHYKLIALSNIDRFAWSKTSALSGVDWFSVITAEDLNHDAPDADIDKLRYLTENVDRDDLLHVAQSLGHDHAPAKKMGMDTVWLVGDGGRWGKESEWKMVLEKGLVGYGWKYATLRDFADAVDQEWSERE